MGVGSVELGISFGQLKFILTYWIEHNCDLPIAEAAMGKSINWTLHPLGTRETLSDTGRNLQSLPAPALWVLSVYLVRVNLKSKFTANGPNITRADYKTALSGGPQLMDTFTITWNQDSRYSFHCSLH